MGLASKLAAAGPPPGAYPPPGGQQQQRPGQYPGQGQYQPYPGGPGGPSGPQGAPPGQYGAPPPAGQYGGPPPGQYGAPPGQQASPANIQAYKQLLQTCIQNKGLQNFYPPNSDALNQIASRAGTQIKQICGRWDLPIEVGNDIVQLALYDIILYVDDSGSMQFEENGERIKDLRIILQRVAYASTLFDDDGISIRFMNSTGQSGSPQLARMIDGVKSDQQIEQIMSNIQFRGLTPMGTELRRQVIDQLVIPKVRSGALRKPILIITITDGQPAGEPQNAVVEAIKYAADECARSRYGAGAISFQFAQVGNDLKAREFLGRLDNDPLIGNLIDSTSNYENEADEMSKLPQPIDLTPQLWLVKLLLGAIDKSYDRKDEKAGASAGGYGGPAGQYGPPGGQYGGPPGQYSAPPPGQYPPPPGQQRPPPGQYAAQPGGYPPQGYGQQYPPQQGGYPGQPPYGRPPPSH